MLQRRTKVCVLGQLLGLCAHWWPFAVCCSQDPCARAWRRCYVPTTFPHQRPPCWQAALLLVQVESSFLSGCEFHDAKSLPRLPRHDSATASRHWPLPALIRSACGGHCAVMHLPASNAPLRQHHPLGGSTLLHTWTVS